MGSEMCIRDSCYVMNDTSTPVKNSTRKSSVENKTKGVAQAGSASPSRALKQPVSCRGIFCSTYPSFSIILRALSSCQSHSDAWPVLQMERVCSAQLRKLLLTELVGLPEQGLFPRKRLALDNVGQVEPNENRVFRCLRRHCRRLVTKMNMAGYGDGRITFSRLRYLQCDAICRRVFFFVCSIN